MRVETTRVACAAVPEARKHDFPSFLKRIVSFSGPLAAPPSPVLLAPWKAPHTPPRVPLPVTDASCHACRPRLAGPLIAIQCYVLIVTVPRNVGFFACVRVLVVWLMLVVAPSKLRFPSKLIGSLEGIVTCCAVLVESARV